MKTIIYLFACLLAISSCTRDHGHINGSSGDIVYLETNDFNDNAVLGYWQQSDGTLTALPGSPFATGGSGLANPTQALGPDDDDNEVRITSDKNFLLAVNSGSNSIAVFRIHDHGSLTPVSGSPFSSGGQNPVSIGENGKYIYVVNKASATDGNVPNYTVFTINNEGALTPVLASTFETTAGTSPAQALVSRDGRFLFGDDFLGFMLTPPVGTLRSFTIGSDGKILPVDGTPLTIPDMGGALGLWQHPTADVLYVGFPLAGKVAVYNINSSTGALTFSNSVAAGLAACWLRTDKAGNYLYALNSGENTISVYNSTNPTSLTDVQKFTLKNSGPTYMAMGLTFTTSEDFSLQFSSSGKYLYVISQYTNPDFSLGNYNLLHVINVSNDGTLSEPSEPLALPVPANVRPKGVVVYDPS